MKISLQSQPDNHPYFEGNTGPLRPPSEQRRITRLGNSLILENDPSLPSDICIKSGHPVMEKINFNLRNPLNPLTWIGKHETVVIGLDRENYKSYQKSRFLSASLLGLGSFCSVLGIIYLNFLLVAGIAFLIGGLAARACFPLWTPGNHRSPNRLVIRGCGKPYLDLFPEEN